MADILSNATNLSNLVPNFYSKRLLERLEPNSRFYQLGEKKKIPANSGKVIIWNRYVQLDNGAALTEGTPIGPSAMSTVIVSASLVQYGNLVKITDMVDMAAISDVVKDAVDVLGDNAAKTIDMYIASSIGIYPSATGGAGALSASYGTRGFPVLYSSASGTLTGETWGDNSGSYELLPLTLSAVRKAVTRLRTLNVPPNEDGFYHGIAHPTSLDELRGDANWATWNQYQRPEKMERGLVGEVEGVKFYDDPNHVINLSVGVFSTASLSSVHPSGFIRPVFILGRGAYAVTELDGAGTGDNATKVYVVPRNGVDKADPLQQFSYVGYKATLAAQILNNSCGVIIGCFANS